MKYIYFLAGLLPFLVACEQPVEKVRGIPAEARVKTEAPTVQTTADELNKKGYKTFLYQEGDSTYLMQQYYIVFFEEGKEPVTGFNYCSSTARAAHGAS